MEYEDRVVCFIDILGFKNHIKQTDTGNQKNDKRYIGNLIHAIEGIRLYTGQDSLEIEAGISPSKQVTLFSDSIVISFFSNEESEVFSTLLSLLWAQTELISHGILCRGAIVRGKLIHTPNYVLGPALVEAYTLEDEATLYPRIILDDSIINTGVEAHGQHHLPEHEEESIRKLLAKDSDGMYYIDYITRGQSELNDPVNDYPKYLNTLGHLIKEGLKNTSPSIAIKHKWLAEKYVPHVKDLKKLFKENKNKKLSQKYYNLPDLH